MAHAHIVSDSDNHFIIDPISRQISNNSKKTILIKTDHNSEQFTFELPRYVEGHDMSLSNKVEVHFLNINSKTRQTNPGIYNVVDFDVDAEDNTKVLGTWLVSREATKYPGSLNFVIRFSCLDDDNVEYYSWNTAIYTGITISDTIENTETIVEDYVDIFRQWLDALELAAGSSDIYAITDDGTFINLCEQINGLDSHVTELEGHVTELEGQVTGYEEQVTTFDTRVTAVEEDVSTFKESVNTDNAAFKEETNGKLADLDKKIPTKISDLQNGSLLPTKDSMPFFSEGLTEGKQIGGGGTETPTVLSPGRYYIEHNIVTPVDENTFYFNQTVRHVVDVIKNRETKYCGIVADTSTSLTSRVSAYYIYIIEITYEGKVDIKVYKPGKDPGTLDFNYETDGHESYSKFYYKKIS